MVKLLKFLKNDSLLPIAVFCAAALITAYIAQYGFGLWPCELCLWQRIAFYIVIILAIIRLLLQNNQLRKLLLLIAIIALVANAGLAFFHTGVEQGWWQGLSSCDGGVAISGYNSLEELRAHILNTPAVRCDKPAIVIWGITMASANIFFCLSLAGWALYRMRNDS